MPWFILLLQHSPSPPPPLSSTLTQSFNKQGNPPSRQCFVLASLLWTPVPLIPAISTTPLNSWLCSSIYYFRMVESQRAGPTNHNRRSWKSRIFLSKKGWLTLGIQDISSTDKLLNRSHVLFICPINNARVPDICQALWLIQTCNTKTEEFTGSKPEVQYNATMLL